MTKKPDSDRIIPKKKKDKKFNPNVVIGGNMRYYQFLNLINQSIIHSLAFIMMKRKFFSFDSVICIINVFISVVWFMSLHDCDYDDDDNSFLFHYWRISHVFVFRNENKWFDFFQSAKIDFHHHQMKEKEKNYLSLNRDDLICVDQINR